MTDLDERKFKIFLASPGDVDEERVQARKVIERIRGERAFRGRIDVVPNLKAQFTAIFFY